MFNFKCFNLLFKNYYFSINKLINFRWSNSIYKKSNIISCRTSYGIPYNFFFLFLLQNVFNLVINFLTNYVEIRPKKFRKSISLTSNRSDWAKYIFIKCHCIYKAYLGASYNKKVILSTITPKTTRL